MSLEIDTNKYRGTCAYFRSGSMICRVDHANQRHQKIKVCSNCTTFTSLDVVYSDVYGVVITPTYDWWRAEWLRAGQPYAKDRMVDFYLMSNPQVFSFNTTVPVVAFEEPDQVQEPVSIPRPIQITTVFQFSILVIECVLIILRILGFPYLVS